MSETPPWSGVLGGPSSCPCDNADSQRLHRGSECAKASVRHVVTIVARGEFQTGARARTEERTLDYHGCGGDHWHILIWLKDISRVCLTHVAAAHAPGYDLVLNFFVNQVYTGGSRLSLATKSPHTGQGMARTKDSFGTSPRTQYKEL